MTMHQQVGVSLVQAALRTGQHVRVCVNGTSMRPLVDVGDYVWVEQAVCTVLRPGDLVTVWHNGGLLTHRVLKVNAVGCITKGDNCRTSDAPITNNHIVGRVVGVERRERRIDLYRRRWRFVGTWVARLGAADAWLVRHPLRVVRASTLIVRAAMSSLLYLALYLED